MSKKDYTSAIRAIFETIPIEKYISDKVSLKRRGSNWLGACPFHNERTPSFHVSPSKGIYKCFGCGKAGNIFQFVIEHEKVDFLDAMRILADYAHIEIEDDDPDYAIKKQKKEIHEQILTVASTFYHESVGQVRNYLNSRKITNESIVNYKLGFSDPHRSLKKELLNYGFTIENIVSQGLIEKNKGALENSTNINDYQEFFINRIMYPIYSERGKIIGFAGRRHPNDTNKENPKFINSPDTDLYNKSDVLYGLDKIKDRAIKEKSITLVEGYDDTIIAHQEGITAAGTCGTALTSKNVNRLSQLVKTVTLASDGDSAGTKAIRKEFELLTERGLTTNAIFFPDNEDPQSFLQKYSIEDYNNLPILNLAQFYIKTSQTDSNNPDLATATLDEIIHELDYMQDPVRKYLWIQNVAKLLDVKDPAVIALKYTQKINEQISKNNTIDYFSDKFINSLGALFVAQILKAAPTYAASFLVDVPISNIPDDGTMFSHEIREVYVKISEQFPKQNYQLTLFGLDKKYRQSLELFEDNIKTNLDNIQLGLQNTRNNHSLNLELNLALANESKKYDLKFLSMQLRGEIFRKKQNELFEEIFKRSLDDSDISDLVMQIDDQQHMR